jgi:DNA repair exonuclease SbcCD ATPase subunit
VVSQFLPLFAATIGLVIGVLLTWLLTRGRLAAAVEQGKAAVAVDLATANERASRVPTLEAQVAGLLDQQEASQREILRLATSEAEKAQSLQSTAARLAETEQALADTERDLTTVSTALQQSNERRATLDAEAARIPILQGKLGDAERLLAETRQQAADSREASGRINAELKAERDALTQPAHRLAGREIPACAGRSPGQQVSPPNWRN